MAEPSKSALRVWGKLSWLCVLALLLLGIWWMFHLPTVGKGGLFLAVGATLMPLFWEKVGTIARMSWIAMLFLLLAVEYRAIDKDRADFARDEVCRRHEENQKFSDIGTAITNNVQKLLNHSDLEFAKTMARSDAIMSGVADSIKTQTGGSSFCYIDFEQALYDVGGMTVIRIGKYPLRDVSAQIMDEAKTRLAVQNFYQSHPPSRDEAFADQIFAIQRASEVMQPVPDFATPSRFIGGYHMTKSSWGQSFQILFRAFNGAWIERLEIRIVNGKWVKAILVEHPVAGKREFFKIDPLYPRVNGKLDVAWPRPVNGKPEWEQ